MKSGLKRDLGLFPTMAIAIGAMVGAGIFILPGVAFMTVDGPAVVLAFLLAGILILPAAFSASEMATAMPEDGGSYVFVERGMGPLLGTIAGVGNWFMLSFKGALALVGGVPYLVFITPGIAEYIIPLAVALAIFFTIINIVSAKSAGRFQFVIVGVMIAALGYFIVGGVPSIVPEQASGAWNFGSGGLLAATALVFISYAGVIKISAVAEEVKDPGKTIPRAMIGSIVFTTALYVAVVYVAVGVVDIPAAIEAGDLQSDGEGPIMALAAEQVLGPIGTAVIVAAALLALASTANAGLLSASRFPFAMARDGLVPPAFERVSPRFSTPVLSVVVSGGVVALMIIFLPIDQVAKFGSAFQIIVFILVNLALIGFREGAVDGYDPVFTSPLYPWMQIFGMASGLLVLTQVGFVPFAGAAFITVVSIVYFYLYVRPRTDREGAARTGVRKSVGETALKRTKDLFVEQRGYDTLVVVTDDTPSETSAQMLRLAVEFSDSRQGDITVGTFTQVPPRIFTAGDTKSPRTDPPEWAMNATTSSVSMDDGRSGGGAQKNLNDTESAGELSNVTFREIETEDVGRAVVEYASFHEENFIMLERRAEELYELYRGGLNKYVLKNAPCAVLLVEDRGFDGGDEIAVGTNSGTYDPVKLLVANEIAEGTGATLTLLQTVPADASDERRAVVQEYHDNLRRILTVDADSRVLETDDRVEGLSRFAESADLLVTTTQRRGLQGVVFGYPGDRLVDNIDCTAVMVQPPDKRRSGLIQRAVIDRLFNN
ncbi:universal stress protein [Halorubrum sp. SD690R]|uniref:amino acid permease n=1 Tax=Halorubrum sp. SD690R TaxID=2518117 RepID=UPI0010F51E56|nr:amino acid permease [Halorubrum sp. SD690R]TKX45613.1 universal stress protein [Halorubrum sp. SD690R]